MQSLSGGASGGGARSGAGTRLIVGTAALASFAVGYALRAARTGATPLPSNESPHTPQTTSNATSSSSSGEQKYDTAATNATTAATPSPPSSLLSSSSSSPTTVAGSSTEKRAKESDARARAEAASTSASAPNGSRPFADAGSLRKLKLLEAELARATKDGAAKAAQHTRMAAMMSERVQTEEAACSKLREELQQARVAQLAAIKRANDLHDATKARAKARPGQRSREEVEAKEKKSLAAAAAFAEAQSQKLLAERHQLRQELSLQAARFAGELEEQREVDRQLHARALEQLEVMRESHAARALKETHLLSEVAQAEKALRDEQQRSARVQQEADCDRARELEALRAQNEEATAERLEASEQRCAEMHAAAVSARESEVQALGEKHAAVAEYRDLQLQCEDLQSAARDSSARAHAEAQVLARVRALEVELADSQASYASVAGLRARENEELERERAKLQAAVRSSSDTLARVEADAAADLATVKAQLADLQQRDREQVRGSRSV